MIAVDLQPFKEVSGCSARADPCGQKFLQATWSLIVFFLAWRLGVAYPQHRALQEDLGETSGFVFLQGAAAEPSLNQEFRRQMYCLAMVAVISVAP